jgi:hypothetical protein
MTSHPEPGAVDNAWRLRAWPLAALLLAVLVAYGAVWTRGLQGDDLCMCELATSRSYWDAVRTWLDNWNGRLFLALTQIATYRLPWFEDPLSAPWFLVHGAVVSAHFAVCALLFSLLVRGGIRPGPALAASLAFSVHPVTFEPVLWLAESFGYVLGNLLVAVSVWAYLEYERGGTVAWLALSSSTALFAILGIEQYLFVLGALAVVHLVSSRWQRPARPAWLPLLIISFGVLVFLALHFVLFAGTVDRLAKFSGEALGAAGPGIAWRMAWWLSLFPDASPYGGFFSVGSQVLAQNGWLVALMSVAVLGAAWRIAVARSWLAQDDETPHQGRLWVIAAGFAVFVGALLPFLFTGRYGFASRNMYVALPGLLVVGAGVLDLLCSRASWRKVLRWVLAPAVAAFLTVSLTINIGAQALFAQSWQLHRHVVHALQTDAATIRQVGAVEVTGIPLVPYQGISMLSTGWAFPCLVRWVIGDGVRGWNNLMRLEDRPPGVSKWHRIRVQSLPERE